MNDDPNAMMGAPAPPAAARANAFQAPPPPPKRPLAPNALTGRGEAAPDLRGRIATLTPAGRAAAAGQAEILAGVGQGLAQRPYPERRALLAHMAAHLAARGLAPDVVARFDPTDANLAGVVSQALTVRAMLGDARPA